MAKAQKGTKLNDWQKLGKQGGICASCTGMQTYLTVEHIIPVHLLQQMGLIDLIYEDEENFELWCRGCNGIKGSRIDPLNPKSGPLMLKYVTEMIKRYAKPRTT